MAEHNNPFVRELTNILKGTAVVESLSKSLVTDAVRECINEISAEYNLDAEEVSAKFEKNIVDRHSSVGAGEAMFCTEIARSGKRCTRLVRFGTLCLVHHKAYRKDEDKKRRITAYCMNLEAQKKHKEKENRPLQLLSQQMPSETEILSLL